MAEVKVVSLGHHPLEAVASVGSRPDGTATLVVTPAGDRTGTGVEQHLGWVEAMAARPQRPKYPIAVTAAQTQALYLHMPVVGRSVPLVKFHDPLWFARLAVGK